MTSRERVNLIKFQINLINYMRIQKHLILIILRIICCTVYLLNLPFSRLKNTNKVYILVYHSICSGNDGDDEWTIPVSLFDSHMNHLSKKGFNVLTVDEIVKILKEKRLLPPKAVCITFDDGFRNNYTQAYPILMKYGFKATFYLATSFIAQDTFPWLSRSGDNRPLKWEDVSIMVDSGMMFGSHTHTHSQINCLSKTEIQNDIVSSFRYLKDNLPVVSKTFVCPFGSTRKTQKLLKSILKKCGYDAAFLGKFGAAHSKSDFFNLPRITIYGDDSLNIFKQKLAGAYDWLTPFYSCWCYLRNKR